jgi:hypothetical protein
MDAVFFQPDTNEPLLGMLDFFVLFVIINNMLNISHNIIRVVLCSILTNSGREILKQRRFGRYPL